MVPRTQRRRSKTPINPYGNPTIETSCATQYFANPRSAFGPSSGSQGRAKIPSGMATERAATSRNRRYVECSSQVDHADVVCGRDPAAARLRITALTTVVARDPEQAMAELAPHYLHIN